MLYPSMRSPTYNNVTTTIILLIFPTISKLVCSFQSSYVKLHNVIIPHSKNCVWSASNDLNCRHKEWSDADKALQQEAATALLPVFFPEHTDGLASMKPMNAEMALKRLLRKKYSQRQSDNQSNFTDQSRKSSIDKSRGRLAELILGTSVMRLRHFVVVAAVAAQDNCTVPLPYPLNYSEISPLFDEKRIIDDFISCSVESKMSICKLMVEEHAKYISSTESSQLEPIQALVGNDDDPTLLIAIEHSIPSFLASSLVSQYGYDTTKQICSLMNDPGPITIRKNAILFKGTDEELCTWLWEKDGVKASPMKNLLKSETMNICSYDLDKVKRYKGNVGVMGQSIRPPAGCICIHPPTDGRGRTKLSKSIWNMLGYQKGFFEVQDAGSQCIVQALDFVPSSISDGTSVLDYCAGNGGKTFAITSAIFDRKINYSESVECKNAIVAHIVSHDVVDERLRQIKGSLSRVGFDLDSFTDIAECNQDNLRCTLQTVTPADIKALSASDTLFEVVLVDVPCSSSGVLRRRPSQRWLMSEEDTLQSLPTLQLDIIQKAATFVRGGGTLVYATCSLLKEENEEVIKSFETSEVFRNGGFVPWPFSEDCIDLSEEDAFRDRHHEITLLPSEWNDGFFFARYTKEL